MTSLLCTAADVRARPALANVTLTAVQTAAMPGLIEEASLLVAAYLQQIGHVLADTVPDEARVVTARVAARVLTGAARPAELDTVATSMGPLGHSGHVAADAIGGGVWLSKADKSILDQLTNRPGMTSMSMLGFTTCPPTPPGNWWLASPSP
jgi:hypothetical protein